MTNKQLSTPENNMTTLIISVELRRFEVGHTNVDTWTIEKDFDIPSGLPCQDQFISDEVNEFVFDTFSFLPANAINNITWKISSEFILD